MFPLFLQICGAVLFTLLSAIAIIKALNLGVIHFCPEYTPNMCVVPASMVIVCHQRENEMCAEIHGYGVQLSLLWWGLGIDWMFDAPPFDPTA
jgi:hypothetical protein